MMAAGPRAPAWDHRSCRKYPPAPDLAADEIALWRASLDAQAAVALEDYRAMLSPDEVERAGRFHFERDRRRYLAGRGILRELLGRYLACDPRKIEFRYGANGKPALATGAADGDPCLLHFNVSHSEGLALYAFTRVGEVGVDLEFIREIPDLEGLADRLFSGAEIARLHACPVECRREEFFHAWTRQEAIVKAEGTGFTNSRTGAAGARWHVQPLNVAPGFAASLAAPPGPARVTLRPWPPNAVNDDSMPPGWHHEFQRV